MIPKTIHYVWLGSKDIPERFTAYIEGWRTLHPDWEIVKWNEENFDCQSNAWIKSAIKQKNYPLAADVMRTWILLNHGGVYLDTDIELFKPLDELVEKNDFFIGYETDFWFGCAILGAKKGHKIMHEVYERYLEPCEKLDSSSNMLCVLNFTASIKRLYNVKLDGKTAKIGDNAMLLSTDWFFPKNYITHKTKMAENTVAKHHYSSVWFSAGKRFGLKVAQTLRCVLGKRFFGGFERIARINMLGKLDREYKKKIKRQVQRGYDTVPFKKIVRNDIGAITKSTKKLKDVYNVIFSHRDLIAYERLVDFEIDAVTYKAHDLEIRAFAAYLKHTYPDSVGRYIAVDLPNAPGFLIAFWGILMSGNKPYLVNSFYPPELRISLLKKLDVRLVITGAADYAGFMVINIGGIINADTFDKKCPQITDEFWQDEFALSTTLTGLEAKICVFDGEAVVNQILNAKEILRKNNWLMNDYQKRIKVAMILPLFHIFGIMAAYFWFAFFGRTMVFLRDNSPETIRGAINRHKVTHIFAPPILFHKLYKGIMNGISQESEKRKNKFQKGVKLAFALQNIFPSLGVNISKRLFREVLAASFGPSPMFMISGGAYIDAEAFKIINCIGYPLFNGYGTTETAISGANLAKKISLRTDGSIGSPFKSVNYKLDGDGTLIVSGSSICKQIITLGGGGSFSSIKTNDIVKIIDGRYFVFGRKSDLFIGENGENISPDTIQNELKVKNANRFCVLELNGRLSLVLEYNEKLPNTIIVNEIEYIKNALTKITYGHNVSGIFVTHQPIANPNAIKISRALLRRRIAEGEVVLRDCKKLNDIAQKNNGADDATMTLIKEAFRCAADTGAEVESASDFFTDLGSDSMGYFSLICEIESIFNIRINLEKSPNLRTPEHFYQYITELL